MGLQADSLFPCCSAASICAKVVRVHLLALNKACCIEDDEQAHEHILFVANAGSLLGRLGFSRRSGGSFSAEQELGVWLSKR